MKNKLITIKTLQKELLAELKKGLGIDREGKEGFNGGRVNKAEIKRLRLMINKLLMDFEKSTWWVYDD